LLTFYNVNTVQAIHYAFMVSVVSAVQCALTLRQIEHTHTPARAAKISPYTIAIQATIDAYLCLAHLGVGLAAHPVLFDSYAVVCFLKFILWAVSPRACEVKL